MKKSLDTSASIKFKDYPTLTVYLIFHHFKSTLNLDLWVMGKIPQYVFKNLVFIIIIIIIIIII
jgi:predicted nucleic acid binding AN1-type Zn finger protein